jgi:hypothetical protein
LGPRFNARELDFTVVYVGWVRFYFSWEERSWNAKALSGIKLAINATDGQTDKRHVVICAGKTVRSFLPHVA